MIIANLNDMLLLQGSQAWIVSTGTSAMRSATRALDSAASRSGPSSGRSRTESRRRWKVTSGPPGICSTEATPAPSRIVDRLSQSV